MLLEQYTKPFFSTTFLVIGVFTLSLIGFMNPGINTALWLIIVIGVAIGSYIKLEFGVLAIAVEIFLGGHGYLFSLPVGQYSISLRIALFVVVSLIWLLRCIRFKKIPRILHLSLKYPIAFFLAFVILGGIIGIIQKNGLLIFYDINAYFAFVYCALFLDAYQNKIQLTRLSRTLTSSLFALSLLTLFLFVSFSTVLYDPSLKGASSVDETVYDMLQKLEGQEGNLAQKVVVRPNDVVLHQEDITATKPLLYRWLRNTGVAEVSYISGRFFRIFFPSHILLVFWLFVPLWALFSKTMQRKDFVINCVVVLSAFASLFIGFSRSLWLGFFIGMVLGVAMLLRTLEYRKMTVTFILPIAAFFLLITGVTGAYKPIINRAQSILHPSSEVATTHRISLLKAIGKQIQASPIFGSGFGTTVSFPTVYGSGNVAVVAFYVFEWAYFDLIVKTGILGFLAFVWILGKISFDLLRAWSRTHQLFNLGLISGFVALMIGNITTPIFTHPLGISSLAILIIFLYASQKNPSANSNVE